MTKYYSAQTGGFYSAEIHPEMPADAVAVTADEHAVLLDGQGKGKRIVADAEGRPLLADPPPPTLAEAQAAKLRQVNRAYETEMAAILTDYPQAETLTWDKQEREARAWQADNTAPTPYIDAIAASRGMDKAELVSRIITKADAWVTLSGNATGKRQRLEDAIAAATDVASVEAITW